MFEQTFKNIDNVLRTEAGCQNELDYIEQPSWIIFLKYLDDFRGRPCLPRAAGGRYSVNTLLGFGLVLVGSSWRY